ncbi:unnamed protein product [Orchesella dallaii]|uniref:Uncharacterized protein n=1 Tax=Orchesella dallaii TaxID=48710 RepID=A0ABP1S9Q5_9HEXA
MSKYIHPQFLPDSAEECKHRKMAFVLELVLVLAILLGWWFVVDKRNHKKYPPGPLRLPILGNILQIAAQSPFPSIAFANLSKKYGEVMYLKMGMVSAVTFNSPQSVHEILSHDKTVERNRTMLPMIEARQYGQNLGIIFSSSEPWQKMRRFTIRTLRDFGFGKAASMDVAIAEELEKFTDHLKNLMSKDGVVQAGSETSSKTMSFAMLYLLTHQNIQEKVQKELDEVVGKGQEVTMEEKGRLPYTQAVVLESLRYSVVVPFPPARQASDDFYFHDYFIKKGAIIMPNLEAVHFDEALWGDPKNFRPERFLKKDMTINSELANKLVHFGGGKRVCLGQNLAESTIFVYFANILSKFQLVKVAGDPEPTTVPEQGMSYSPQPFRVIFKSRK